jgi:putative toxin-antitoxin system antitoxin component (TIGR02293 family)
VKEVRAGLPYAVLEAIARDFRLDLKDLVEILAIPWSTLARRRKAGRFRPDESDRLYRLACLAAMAAGVLGSNERAARWLREPNRALGLQAPLRLLDTEVGSRQVEAVLGRIEHGVWS